MWLYIIIMAGRCTLEQPLKGSCDVQDVAHAHAVNFTHTLMYNQAYRKMSLNQSYLLVYLSYSCVANSYLSLSGQDSGHACSIHLSI